MHTAAVLTISDSSFQRKRQDISGPAVARRLEAAEAGYLQVRLLERLFLLGMVKGYLGSLCFHNVLDTITLFLVKTG